VAAEATADFLFVAGDPLQNIELGGKD